MNTKSINASRPARSMFVDSSQRFGVLQSDNSMPFDPPSNGDIRYFAYVGDRIIVRRSVFTPKPINGYTLSEINIHQYYAVCRAYKILNMGSFKFKNGSKSVRREYRDERELMMNILTDAYVLSTDREFVNYDILFNNEDRSLNRGTNYWECQYFLRNLGNGECVDITKGCYTTDRRGRIRADYAMIEQYRYIASSMPSQWEFIEHRIEPRQWTEAHSEIDNSWSMPEMSLIKIINDRSKFDEREYSILGLYFIRGWKYKQISQHLNCSMRDISSAIGKLRGLYWAKNDKMKYMNTGVRSARTNEGFIA